MDCCSIVHVNRNLRYCDECSVGVDVCSVWVSSAVVALFTQAQAAQLAHAAVCGLNSCCAAEPLHSVIVWPLTSLANKLQYATSIYCFWGLLFPYAKLVYGVDQPEYWWPAGDTRPAILLPCISIQATLTVYCCQHWWQYSILTILHTGNEAHMPVYWH